MSSANLVILKYRNPGKRETVAVASQLEVECTRRGAVAHAIATDAEMIEVWITQFAEPILSDPPITKGSNFVGVIDRSDSEAPRASASIRAIQDLDRQKAMAVARRGGIDRSTHVAVDKWWSNLRR